MEYNTTVYALSHLLGMDYIVQVSISNLIFGEILSSAYNSLLKLIYYSKINNQIRF